MFSLSPIKIAEGLVRNTPGAFSLAQGIPSFPIPNEIFEELQELVASGKCNSYLAPEGLPELRELLFQKEVDIQRKEGDLIITNGAIEGVLSSLLALTVSGDEVVTSNPGYASFERAISVSRVVPRLFLYGNEENSFASHRFHRLLNPRTKVVLIAQPNNPDGRVFRKEELEELIRLARKHAFFILSDETYRDFLWEGRKMVSPWELPGGEDVCIRVTSYSKSFGVTGWRVGVVTARAETIQRILPVHDTCVTCAPAVSQYLAFLLEKRRERLVEQNRMIIQRRLQMVIDGLAVVRGLENISKPEAGYYLFPKLSHGQFGDEFVAALFRRAKVSLVSGSAFGSRGRHSVRISVASSEENLVGALDAIQRAEQTPPLVAVPLHFNLTTV